MAKKGVNLLAKVGGWAVHLGTVGLTMGNRYRRLSFAVLCLGLLFATVLVGPPVHFPMAVGLALAAVLLTTIATAAWKSGLDLVITGPQSDQSALAGATFLILPVASLSLMSGYGPPEFADHLHNAFRYVVLLIDTASVGIGMVLVQDALSQAGERLFAKLSLGLIVAATSLYLVWAALLLEDHRAALAAAAWASGPWSDWLMDFSDVLLFFGGLFTYLATASLAIAIGRAAWIGSRTAWTFALVNLAALACLVARGITFPDPRVVFAQVYSIPGWIAGIPAVPWIIPCILGLMLIRRAAAGSMTAPTPGAARTTPIGPARVS